MSDTAFTEPHRLLVKMLTEARVNLGMHQADLAAKLGKDQSLISRIERNQRRIDVVEFCQIVDALGLDREAFFSSFSTKLRQLP